MALFRYRERFGLTYDQLLDEPAEEIIRAAMIWEYDAEKRDKLEKERQNK